MEGTSALGFSLRIRSCHAQSETHGKPPTMAHQMRAAAAQQTSRTPTIGRSKTCVALTRWRVFFGCVVFAEWSVEDADAARPMESDRAKLLLRGLRHCWGEFQRQRETPQRQLLRHAGRMPHCTKVPHEGLMEVLSFERPHDPRVQSACGTSSRVCENVFHGTRGLQIHMFTKHREQTYFVATHDCTCVWTSVATWHQQ